MLRVRTMPTLLGSLCPGAPSKGSPRDGSVEDARRTGSADATLSSAAPSLRSPSGAIPRQVRQRLPNMRQSSSQNSSTTTSSAANHNSSGVANPQSDLSRARGNSSSSAPANPQQHQHQQHLQQLQELQQPEQQLQQQQPKRRHIVPPQVQISTSTAASRNESVSSSNSNSNAPNSTSNANSGSVQRPPTPGSALRLSMQHAAAQVSASAALRFTRPRNRKQSRRVRGQQQEEQPESLAAALGAHVSSSGSLIPRELEEEERFFLVQALQKHFIFQDLEASERSDVVGFMEQVEVEPGEVVCRQGDVGDCCYVIEEGSFAVIINGTIVQRLHRGQTFGELSMLYRTARTATVTCTDDGVLWKMNGGCFRLCMTRLTDKHLQRALAFLEMDSTFSSLSDDERRKLAGACAVQRFMPGDVVVRAEEEFHCLMIVGEGALRARDGHGRQIEHRPGSMLGSISFLCDHQPSSFVQALEPSVVLVITKSALERLLGPAESTLRRSALKSLLRNDSVGSGAQLLRHLSEEQQDLFIESMKSQDLLAGDVLVRSGGEPEFVLVLDGEAAPRAANRQDVKENEKIVAGMGYGAENLVDGSRMETEVVALTPMKVTRISYQQILETFGENLDDLFQLKEVRQALHKLFVFKNLSESQLMQSIKAMERQSFKKGETLVTQGEPSRQFFLVLAGSLKVCAKGQQAKLLGQWDSVGEQALVLERSPTATVVAQEPGVCLRLDREKFRSILGRFYGEVQSLARLQDKDISMSDLCVKAIVGRGNFGVVKLVHHRSDESQCYALKCVNKQLVVQQGQQKSMKLEREMSALCCHLSISQFIRSFQDATNVYFLTEFLAGGELFQAMREIGGLSKPQAQFFSGCMITALEYLHSLNIMYRDLKPENVMLDERGYAKLVDFGCSKLAVRTSTVVGTPEYMAPEMIAMLGYSSAVDWWSLGVVMHELIVGPLPFGQDIEDELELLRAIREAPLKFPSRITDKNAISVISGLLTRTPELRLGGCKQGAKEIKDHPYFKDFDWEGLASRSLDPPYQPNLSKTQRHWELCHGDPASSLDLESMDKSESSSSWAKRVSSLASLSLVDLVGPRRTSVPRGMEWAADF